LTSTARFGGFSCTWGFEMNTREVQAALVALGQALVVNGKPVPNKNAGNKHSSSAAG
jgi:hypothetical protein